MYFPICESFFSIDTTFYFFQQNLQNEERKVKKLTQITKQFNL